MTSATTVSGSIESRASWVIALTALAILSFSHGAPLVLVVAMKAVSTDLDVPREVPALAISLGWIGTGVGSIYMGWVADRIGVRWTVMAGAAMIGVGLGLCALGTPWALYVGLGLFAGFIGNAGINTPLLVYVSRWFDRRRGTALALISSGQYVAGMIWPTLFEYINATHGWRVTSAAYGALIAVVVIPVAWLMLRPPPEGGMAGGPVADAASGGRVLGLPPNLVMYLLGAAAFLCCVPMALPQQHLVAFCSDLGFAPGRGAVMLSTLLAAAFLARQFWGWVSDRFGGLLTILLGSLWQALTIAGFLATQDEAGLFAVAVAYGLGFSGIIPAYVLTVRQLFPASEAGWRVPIVMFPGMAGMAFGGWFAGLLYDRFGFYAPAFGAGIGFNVLNLLIVAFLVWRWRLGAGPPLPALAARAG